MMMTKKKSKKYLVTETCGRACKDGWVELYTVCCANFVAAYHNQCGCGGYEQLVDAYMCHCVKEPRQLPESVGRKAIRCLGRRHGCE